MMFQLKELKIPKNEVLRYLGYKSQEIEDELNKLIDITIDEAKKIINPKFIYSTYNSESKEDAIYINKTNLKLTGDDIKNHLLFAKESVIMAATIGSYIEKKISLYEKTNLTKAMILDACGTTAVEEICDQIDDYVKEEGNKKNLATTFRFSPGYGDLSLDIQKDIINVLKADKIIGLTVSSHNILFPRKSVTAIIGLIPKGKETKQRGCEVCKNFNNCNYRREGNSCGI